MHLRLVLIFCLYLIFSGTILSQENEDSSEVSPFASTKKKVMIWKGDVVGIYKNRVWIKIRVYRNQKIAKYSIEKLKSLFEPNKSYSVFQKETNLPVGSFLMRERNFEEKNLTLKDKFFEVVLIGDYLPDKNSRMSAVTTDAYIASYVEEDFYVEPDNYFKGRFTTPRKNIFHPIDKKEMVLVNRGLFIYGQGSDASLDNFNPYFSEPSRMNQTQRHWEVSGNAGPFSATLASGGEKHIDMMLLR